MPSNLCIQSIDLSPFSDSDVDPTNSQRLGFNENEPFYLEPRARNLDEDDARSCPLASMYVNCYYLADDEAEDGDKADVEDGSGLVLRMKSLQLDSVRRWVGTGLCLVIEWC